MVARPGSRGGGCPSSSFFAAVLLLSFVIPIPACGGGAAGEDVEIVDTFDLGFVAVAGSTRVEFDFASPAEMAATVTAAGATGPFRMDPSDLPALASPGGTVRLGVLCEPSASGYVEGTVSLRFEAGAATKTAIWKVQAWGEPVSLELLTTSIDFGSLLIGDEAVRTVTLYNRSTDSAAVVSRIDVPPGDYTVEGVALPLTIPPDAVRTFDLRFAPAGEGTMDGNVVVRSNGSSGPLTLPVTGSGWILGEELVTDYGEQPLDTAGRTPLLTVNVPADAISLSVEGTGTTGDQIRLDTLTGPGGFVYENSSGTGPYLWGTKVFAAVTFAPQAFLTTIPNTDRAPLQLVAGGGTYSFRLRQISGSSTTMRVRAFVERRAPVIASKGILDLNVFFTPNCGVSAATVASAAGLKSSFDRMDAILSTQGIRLGEIAWHDLTDPSFDSLSMAELDSLLQQSSRASEERLNLFFVGTFDPGYLGIAACVSGVRRKGTAASGVVVALSIPITTDTRGIVMAHEAGHFLGLYHCVEAGGAPDIIDDTPTGANTGNLMDSNAGTVVTNGQGFVMRAHPLVRMDPDAWSPPLLLRPLSDETRHELKSFPAGWCGSCGR